MTLDQLIQTYLDAIENELEIVIKVVDSPDYVELYNMMAYHMGWEGQDVGIKARGKRIRPLLVLLTTAAAGGEWEDALPAAASVELIHNFSLLHDDIEDRSQLRRGRPTVWKIWGISQAINAGDSMFSLAHLAMFRLGETTSPLTAYKAFQVLDETCLHLTQGQFLDISYEDRQDLTLEDYWPMVTGKTATLLAACTELGALVAQLDEYSRAHYRSFGLNLGLAFQALDDLLGIWGDSGKTGKSTTSDLEEGKKSLPVLYSLDKNGRFATRWVQGNITPDEVPELARQMEIEGAKDFTQEMADHYTTNALVALKNAKPLGEAGRCLTQLAKELLQREV